MSNSKKGRAGLKHFANKHSCKETRKQDELHFSTVLHKALNIYNTECVMKNV